MSEFRSVAGCIILNPAHQAVLLKRASHNEWQLPGGTIEDGELAIAAAAREVHEKLGIAVTALHKVAQTTFTRGDIDYRGALFQVTAFEGELTNMQPNVYDGPVFHNLFKRDIGRIGLSPFVEHIAEELADGKVFLDQKYPVQ